VKDFEFYETPAAFTRWLFKEEVIGGRVFEPCVGGGAIVEAAFNPAVPYARRWFTNDLDPRWPADVHKDATDVTLWQAHEFDWTVSNPPFTPALDIITLALEYSRVGVAMHLRASIHEVLKTGIRRTWMAKHEPTGILWLPRFAYQRSQKTGQWTTDSVCACWVIWHKQPSQQFIRYAPEWVIDALDAETPAYRRRMDGLMMQRHDPSMATWVPVKSQGGAL
jgi:hypothetical protein